MDHVNGTFDDKPHPETGSIPVPTNIGSSPIQSVYTIGTVSGLPIGSSPYLMSSSPTLTPSKPSLVSQNQNQLSSTSPQNKPATNQYLQQPIYFPQYAQSSSKYPPTVSAKPPQTLGQIQQTSLHVSTSQPANQPQVAASANPVVTITSQSSTIYKPIPLPLPPQPSVDKPPGGLYIATVNYGPGQPSAVFTCFQTQLLDEAVLESGEYASGPRGYSCKASRGRPFLSNLLLSANRQSPVSQPIISKEPTTLPIIVPIKFVS